MKRGFEDYGRRQTWTADVCVVGAGAGGAAVACALAERGLDVLVLEEGRHWKPRDFKADSAWAYRNLYAGRGGRSAVGNTLIPVPGGRGVGGSTLINSAICFRTPHQVLDEWVARSGCHRLAPALMDPRLDRVWDTIKVTVNPPVFQKENNLIFKKGAEAMGLDGHWMARSAPGCVGCGVCQMGCPTGGKLTVDRSFLQEALDSGRCRCHADCRVDGVETDGTRITAVTGRTIDPDTIEPAGHFRVEARVFVLSAGPIGTPRFLLGNDLTDDSVCGHHLHLHPTSGMMAKFDHEIRPWTGVTQGYYVDCWEDGFLLQVYSTTPDQIYVGLPHALGTELAEIIADMKHMAMAGPLVHDEDSVGRVTSTGLTYFLGDHDRLALIAGMRRCAEVFFAAGARRVYAGVVGGRAIATPDDIDQVLHDDLPARHLYVYASHPMGTCRMGDDPDTSVVDPDGRVWGWDNLHVADASVFPTSLGVNPQVTVMAVGLTIGEAVAEALG